MAMKIDEEVENIKLEQDKVIEVLPWEDWIFLWQFLSNNSQKLILVLSWLKIFLQVVCKKVKGYVANRLRKETLFLSALSLVLSLF